MLILLPVRLICDVALNATFDSIIAVCEQSPLGLVRYPGLTFLFGIQFPDAFEERLRIGRRSLRIIYIYFFIFIAFIIFIPLLPLDCRLTAAGLPLDCRFVCRLLKLIVIIYRK